MENDTVLKVENLSKKFCRTLKRSLFYGTVDITRSMFGIGYDTGTLRKAEFWALDDVSFDLKKGETLGIIGVNGSGKSTLLRLITGIFPPDKGCISYKGRIGALIAVGAGFHPHMTGKENIYLNGTILGMTKKEIDSKLDEIVEFADIGDFLEAPVSTYSSGMTVRLGFSIAVHCEPDILLVDEVLAVGDLGFRNKSMRKMNEFRKKAKALIFVSHHLEQIKVLCDRVIVMGEGKILFDGNTDEGIIRYENQSKASRVASINSNYEKNGLYRLRKLDGNRVNFYDLGIISRNGMKVNQVNVDEAIRVYLDFSINEYCKELYFTLALLDEQRKIDCLWVKSNDSGEFAFKNNTPGNYRVIVELQNHNLGPGVYFINYAIRNGDTGETYDHGFTEISFAIKSDKHFERGVVMVDDRWELVKR